MQTVGVPFAVDPRWYARWERALREGGGPQSYRIAGRAVAEGGLDARRSAALVEAMLARLPIVRARSEAHDDPALLTELAALSAPLALLRPDRAPLVRACVGLWRARVRSPEALRGADALAAWTLLALAEGEGEQAAAGVEALWESERPDLAGLLHDWVVARLQGHGAMREAHCAANFVWFARGTHRWLLPLVALAERSGAGRSATGHPTPTAPDLLRWADAR